MKTKTTRPRRTRRTRSAPPVAACPLPHERDQAPDARGTIPHEEIAMAERDVREGRVDTDNYTRLREVAEAGLRKRR